MTRFEFIHIGHGKCLSTMLQRRWAESDRYNYCHGLAAGNMLSDAFLAGSRDPSRHPVRFALNDQHPNVLSYECFTFFGCAPDVPTHQRHQTLDRQAFIASALAPFSDRVLLVLRDPRDAIASHLSDQMGSRLLVTERQIASATAVELDRLHGLLDTVRSYPSHMRLHVNFETLTGAEGSSFAAASALLTEVGLDQAALDEMDWPRRSAPVHGHRHMARARALTKPTPRSGDFRLFRRFHPSLLRCGAVCARQLPEQE